jgi:16S rRNA (cytosine967-C5)-methyltransferase
VELLTHKDIGFKPHKGLVNAILRQACKDRGGLAAELDSLPAQLDRSPFAEKLLKAALGDRRTPENAEALWARLQQPSSPAFVALRGDVPDGFERDAQFPDAWRITPRTRFPREWLVSGAGMAQDISSQVLMVFRWSTETAEPRRILDVCAAPGGKTTTLARRWPQALVIALEQNPDRARRLRENLAARQVGA